MKIIKKTDSLNITKPEGIDVRYYLFDEYEIHMNIQKPNTTQVWHHHEKITETILIIEGELLAEWKINEKSYSQIVSSGDLVETENTAHTFTNKSNQDVKFIVFKQLLNGQIKKEILKNDKILDY